MKQNSINIHEVEINEQPNLKSTTMALNEKPNNGEIDQSSKHSIEIETHSVQINIYSFFFWNSSYISKPK